MVQAGGARLLSGGGAVAIAGASRFSPWRTNSDVNSNGFAAGLRIGGAHFRAAVVGGLGEGEAQVGAETSFANPFELLFYVLIAIALPLRHADLVIVLLSWVFVITRFVHAGVFVTSNNVSQRGLTWFAGVLVLFAMWLYFALRILLVI